MRPTSQAVVAMTLLLVIAVPGRGVRAEDDPECAAAGALPVSVWREVRQGRAGFDPLHGSIAPQPAMGRVDLLFPAAVAARSTDLYIFDSGARAILHFDLATETLTRFAEIAAMQPRVDLYVDDGLSLYMADPFNGEVLRFARDGRVVQRFSHPIELSQPSAVITDRLGGEVIVADGFGRHVFVLNQLGGVSRTIGAELSGGPEFSGISAMARAGDVVYLVDPVMHEIRFSHLDNPYWGAFGGSDLLAPGAIAADRHGRVFVVENADNSIKVFVAGELAVTIGQRALSSLSPFSRIFDLWIDDPYLYVADAPNARVVVLQLKPPCEPG